MEKKFEQPHKESSKALNPLSQNDINFLSLSTPLTTPFPFSFTPLWKNEQFCIDHPGKYDYPLVMTIAPACSSLLHGQVRIKFLT